MSTADQNTLPLETDLELEISSSDAILNSIKEAFGLVDTAISEISHRQTVPTSEMIDLLLDVRLVLAPLIS